MTEQLEQDALDFIRQVENLAKDEGYQTAKKEFDAQVAQLKFDYDKRIVEARETYYNEGFKDGQQSQTETPVIYPPVNMADGEEFSNDKTMLVASFAYSRKFPTNWGTLILPVMLNYSDWSSKFEIAEIVGVEVGKSIVPKRKVLGTGSQTLPNHPYLIRAKKASSAAQTIAKKNCNIYPSIPGEVEFSVGDKKYTFKGTYNVLTTEELKGKYYSSNGSFVPAVSKCNPMRVYLEIS